MALPFDRLNASLSRHWERLGAEPCDYEAPGVAESVRVQGSIWEDQPRGTAGGGVGVEEDRVTVHIPAAYLAEWGEDLRADSYATLIRYPDDLSAREEWVSDGKPSLSGGYWRFGAVRR